MTKQLLIYQSATPLSALRHSNVSLETNDDYTFSAGVNAVPLMAVELVRAATEYAIVFTAAATMWCLPQCSVSRASRTST